MIEITRTLTQPGRIANWLESIVRPHLSQDVSNYAKGRLRCWLNVEPHLGTRGGTKPGLPVHQSIINRMAELIDWQFDYCLVTYSGDQEAIGIDPHRDAGYADYEAYGLTVSGESLFRYWEGREAFGYAPETNRLTANDPSTHQIVVKPGMVTRFNCKNIHSAEPGTGRWGLNFWRAKNR